MRARRSPIGCGWTGTRSRNTWKYGAGGLAQLLAEDYRRPGGGLDSPAEQLKALFGKQPPHTVNHAIERIEQETGLRLQPSAGRELLHKLGLKPRCCGWVPGKALEDGAQQRAPQEFHDRTRQPMLEEAQRGQRVIRFVATAHFVMGALLGMLGCLARQWLPSSSGRRRDNVLGTDDPIRHEVITLTNDTVVNPETFCALLDKIATAYAGTGPLSPGYGAMRATRNVRRYLPRPKRWGSNSCTCPPIPPPEPQRTILALREKAAAHTSTCYSTFAAFKESIDGCLRDLGTRFKCQM